MRRLLVLLLILAVAGLSAFAQAQPTKLTLWTFQELHLAFYSAAMKAWNTQNPGKQVDLDGQVFPYADMHNKLLVAVQSGVGAPDIADIEISKFPNFLQGNIGLVPLNDVIDPFRDKFVQARLAIYAKNGKNYGLPFHVGASVVYYNMDIMKAAGVNIDKIETWDDYVKAGQQVMAKTGKPMTTVETTDQWSYWPLIAEQKSDFFDPSGKIWLDNPTNVKTLQFLQDLVYKYKIAVTTPGGFHHSEQYYGAMNSGSFGSIWMPMWYMGRFTDYMPDLAGKIAIRPMPRWTKGGYRSAGMGGTGTAVLAQSQHIDLAKKFLFFAKGSKQGNIMIWQVLGFDPPRWDVWGDPAMSAPNKFTEYFQNGDDVFKMLLQVKDEIYPVTLTAKTPDLTDMVRNNIMVQVIQDRSKTPEQALKEAADQLRK
ncbi:MAG TPA: extracellular solute-binding protein [Spirochaetia bacterium]|nr:extracellular solute-binding protein [Spirochaetia bacterium]